MPTFEPKREVRFAVVLYGGTSLAIYINGVTQELFRMVRSTAGDPAPGSTEEIYREAAHAAGDARLAVEIISGSSAGGINGVSLAKALALDSNLDGIQRLWIQQADIGKLLNDGPGASAEPDSLFDSRSMYAKLLDAIRGMDRADAPVRSRLIPGELDLFVTATDLHGLAISIPLADKDVLERKHRTVFRFEYRPERGVNHFTARFSPFLAFAARCTSSLPVVFEPMTLADIEPVLRQRGIQPDFEAWKPLHPDIDRDRPLADGGYLDGKPFSFAIDRILAACPELPADRKLLYVEPVPADLERDRAPMSKPDALENGWAALSALPRHETIREDLDRILRRNSEIGRMNRLLASMESDGQAPPRFESAEWRMMDSAAVARRRGREYLAYRHLRVSSVTDDIARATNRQRGIEPAAAAATEVRNRLRSWRWETYQEHVGDRADTLNEFLQDFDIAFRLRRIRHLQRKMPASAELKPLATVLSAAYSELSLLLESAAEPSADLAARCRAAFEKASGAIAKAIREIADPDLGAQLQALYDGFEDYDALTFPMLHNSGVGEPDIVEIFRISPEDATSLIDERKEQTRKLRGTAFASFGGFLDEGWRKNDILWGRLDGAERIITALLPGDQNAAARRELIDRANAIIIREELGSQQTGTTREIIDRHRQSLNEQPDRQDFANWFTRAASILGPMLERIAGQRRLSKKPFAFLTRIARVAWGIVEVLSPRSIADLFFRHFMKLAWFVGLFLVTVGVFIKGLRATGWTLVAWLAVVQILAWLIRDWLGAGRRAARILGFAAGTILVALLVAGAGVAWDWIHGWLERYFSFA